MRAQKQLKEKVEREARELINKRGETDGVYLNTITQPEAIHTMA